MKAALAVTAVLLLAATAQSQVRSESPRASNGRPDLSGVWQTLNTAHWNLEPHVSAYPVVLELGAQFAVPPGHGVVVGGAIPYLPEARAERDRRFANRVEEDPEAKCYLGGVPRSTYSALRERPASTRATSRSTPAAETTSRLMLPPESTHTSRVSCCVARRGTRPPRRRA